MNSAAACRFMKAALAKANTQENVRNSDEAARLAAYLIDDFYGDYFSADERYEELVGYLEAFADFVADKSHQGAP